MLMMMLKLSGAHRLLHILMDLSTDDPFLPINEQRKVGQGGLAGRCRYVEVDDRSHWFEPCQELLDEVLLLIEGTGDDPEASR